MQREEGPAYVFELSPSVAGVWTVLSLVFHLVRLAQALLEAARGRPVVSWLA